MLRRILWCLNRVTLWVSGLSILMMTLIGGFDVLSAVILQQPIPGTYEATETLMVFTVFLALGYLHQERAYISVDLGYRAMGPICRRLVDVAVLLLMAAYFSAIAWRGWDAALRSWSIGEYSMGLINFPLYPSKFALALGASLAILCCVADLLAGGQFRDAVRQEDESRAIE